MVLHDKIALIFTASDVVLDAVDELSILLAFTILLNSIQPGVLIKKGIVPVPSCVAGAEEVAMAMTGGDGETVTGVGVGAEERPRVRRRRTVTTWWRRWNFPLPQRPLAIG
ncbi:hypothetical protein EJB05_32372, partial [Eragrostis curvula]